MSLQVFSLSKLMLSSPLLNTVNQVFIACFVKAAPFHSYLQKINFILRKSYPLFLWISEGYFLSIFLHTLIITGLSVGYASFLIAFIQPSKARRGFFVLNVGDFRLKLITLYITNQ